MPKGRRQTPTSSPAKRWALKRILLIALILAICFPPSQVLLTRWWNPTVTTVMWQREWQHGDWPREHQWVNIDAIPNVILWYSVLAEDGRFFEHNGIDWIELNAAVGQWKETGEAPRGASTITMQAARSLFLWQGRSYARKILECYYALCMEALLSKERILELYLNSLETGPGVYGLAAGAEHHFDRPLDKLSHQQMALLVALFPNPIARSGHAPSAVVQKRQRQILRNAQKWKKPEALVHGFR